MHKKSPLFSDQSSKQAPGMMQIERRCLSENHLTGFLDIVVVITRVSIFLQNGLTNRQAVSLLCMWEAEGSAGFPANWGRC